MLKNKRTGIYVFVVSLFVVMITLFILEKVVFNYEYVIEPLIKEEKIVNIDYEYYEGILFVGGRSKILIETEKQSYIFNQNKYNKVEYVKADEPSLTVNVKKGSSAFKSIKDPHPTNFITIYVDEEMLKELSDLYVKTYRENLIPLIESEYESFDKIKPVD